MKKFCFIVMLVSFFFTLPSQAEKVDCAALLSSDTLFDAITAGLNYDGEHPMEGSFTMTEKHLAMEALERLYESTSLLQLEQHSVLIRFYESFHNSPLRPLLTSTGLTISYDFVDKKIHLKNHFSKKTKVVLHYDHGWRTDSLSAEQVREIGSVINAEIQKIHGFLTGFLNKLMSMRTDLPLTPGRTLLFAEDADLKLAQSVLFTTDYPGSVTQLGRINPSDSFFSDRFKDFQERLRSFGYQCDLVKKLPRQSSLPIEYEIVQGKKGNFPDFE